MSFLEELKNRRSIYALGRNTEVSDEKIVEIIKEAVRQSPSAFNSQTSRVVILLNDEVTKFWDELVANDLVETMKVQGAPETAIAGTKEKLASFGASKGTVLFFEDQDVVKSLQEQFVLYADNFPVWSEQSTGIASVNTWTAPFLQNLDLVVIYNITIQLLMHQYKLFMVFQLVGNFVDN